MLRLGVVIVLGVHPRRIDSRFTGIERIFELLLSYAIGRALEYYDQPTVRAIARSAEENEYKVSSLILGVVKSDAFQMRQTQTTAN